MMGVEKEEFQVKSVESIFNKMIEKKFLILRIKYLINKRIVRDIIIFCWKLYYRVKIIIKKIV